MWYLEHTFLQGDECAFYEVVQKPVRNNEIILTFWESWANYRKEDHWKGMKFTLKSQVVNKALVLIPSCMVTIAWSIRCIATPLLPFHHLWTFILLYEKRQCEKSVLPNDRIQGPSCSPVLHLNLVTPSAAHWPQHQDPVFQSWVNLKALNENSVSFFLSTIWWKVFSKWLMNKKIKKPDLNVTLAWQ